MLHSFPSLPPVGGASLAQGFFLCCQVRGQAHTLRLDAGQLGHLDRQRVNVHPIQGALGDDAAGIGLPLGQFEGSSTAFFAFVHPDDRAAVQAASDAAGTAAHPYDIEHRIVRPDGEVRWCVGTAAATLDKSGRVIHVSGVTVATLSGVRGTISARNYALCCGGIENARLLLLGSPHAPAGLGNGHDLVGRYFMEHLRAVAATPGAIGSQNAKPR